MGAKQDFEPLANADSRGEGGETDPNEKGKDRTITGRE